jgi:hypothetical protein
MLITNSRTSTGVFRHAIELFYVFTEDCDDDLVQEDFKRSTDEELLIFIRCRKYNVQAAFETVSYGEKLHTKSNMKKTQLAKLKLS